MGADKKVCLFWAAEDDMGAAAAEAVKAALSGCAEMTAADGVCEPESLCEPSEPLKQLLTDADALIILASNASFTESRGLEPLWQFFIDEIKWKRKENGEIVLLDASTVSYSPSRLPYALKKCKRFRTAALGDAVKYIVADKIERPTPESRAAARSLSSAQEAAQRMDRSRPDKQDNPKAQETSDNGGAGDDGGACREDHVLGEDKEQPGGKSYVRDDGGVCREDHVFGEGKEQPGGKSYVRDDGGACREDDVFGEDKKQPDGKSYVRDDGGACREDHVFDYGDQEQYTDGDNSLSDDKRGEDVKPLFDDTADPFAGYPDHREKQRRIGKYGTQKSLFSIIFTIVMAVFIIFSLGICSRISSFTFSVQPALQVFGTAPDLFPAFYPSFLSALPAV